MKFKYGDRVRIIAEIENSYGRHWGQTGTVIEARAHSRMGYVVRWDSNPDNHLCYDDESLEFEHKAHLLMTPEMELSEIEEAEYLMQELSK